MSDRRFLANFVLLSIVSGLTIGLGKVVTQLYALSLGANSFQIGIVSATESIGMMLVTVPAGFVIARYGTRSVYFLASLGPLLINSLMPFSRSWALIALGQGLIGLCIPFRIVSMNSTFLERLNSLGQGKAGWYRGTQQAGMAILGPAIAAVMAERYGLLSGFWTVSFLFGLMALFSLSFMPDRPAPAKDAPGFFAELRLLGRDSSVSESCLTEFLSSATGSLFSTFIILLAAGLPGLTEKDGIHVMLFQGSTTVVMLLFGGVQVARLGRGQAYAVGAGLAALALATFGSASGFGMLAVAAVLLSAGSAIVHLTNVRVLAGLPGGKSKVAGLYNLASMTGSSFGAIGGGLISRVVPLQAVYLAWLPVLAAGAAAVLLLHRRRVAAAALVPELSR